jgi:S-adenosylmethionine:tRNA-ribosyltransferase-isomerase (queuine synthetase)
MPPGNPATRREKHTDFIYKGIKLEVAETLVAALHLSSSPLFLAIFD